MTRGFEGSDVLRANRARRTLQVAALLSGLMVSGPIAVPLVATVSPGSMLILFSIALALVSPYAAILWCLRTPAAADRVGLAVLIARAAGGAFLVAALSFAGVALVLSAGPVELVGPFGYGVVLAAAQLALLTGARSLAAAHPESAAPVPVHRLLAYGAAGLVVVLSAMLWLPAVFRGGHYVSNESRTVGDIRTMFSAQAAYESATGSYGLPACLVTPARCIPGYQGPTFLDRSFLDPIRAGYVRSFLAEPPPAPRATGTVPAGSVGSFAWVAVPLVPGKTGTRGFCGDHTGAICFTKDGTMPPMTEGHCPTAQGCETLR